MHKVLNSMVDGQIKLIARTDKLILDYGAKLVAKKGLEKGSYIREKVREMCRFLIEM